MSSKVNSKYNTSRKDFFAKFSRNKVLLSVVLILVIVSLVALSISLHNPATGINKTSQPSKYTVTNFDIDKTPFPENSKSKTSTTSSRVNQPKQVSFLELLSQKPDSTNPNKTMTSEEAQISTIDPLTELFSDDKVGESSSDSDVFDYRSLPVEIVVNAINNVLKPNDITRWEQSELYKLNEEIAAQFYQNPDQFQAQYPEGFALYRQALTDYDSRMNQFQ